MLRHIYFISDHTGITTEVLGRSLMARFEGQPVRYVTRPFVDSLEKVQAVALEINQAAQEGPRPLVFTSITNPELAAALRETKGLLLDLFAPYLGVLEAELGQTPSERVGRFHRIADLASYQMRMDAIDFALTTDDGLGTHLYERADIILVGVSRAGKTPTCLYLGLQYGIRASNYPLADDDFEKLVLPEAIRDYRAKIFGLTIDPIRLHQIRQERKPNSSYATLNRCEHEVKRAEELFRAAKVGFLNTTTTSIEEIAATIMQAASLTRRLY